MDQLTPDDMSRRDSRMQSHAPSPSKPFLAQLNPSNSPPIPTTSTSTREPAPMDGQPQACKCQCHTERDNSPGDPFCCPPIDSTPDPAPIDVTESLRRAGAERWYLPPEPRSIAKIVGIVEMTEAERERGLARLRFAVAWCGPWERLEAWLLGIDAGSLDLRRVIREHSLREAFAVWCGSRDLAWQRQHVEAGTTPHRRWSRSTLTGSR